MFRESNALSSITDRFTRRGLLIGSAISGVALLATGMPDAAAQPTPGPGGIEWLDYTPPRRYAAGARFGNVVYLAGETGQDLTTGKTIEGGIGPQTQLAFENIRHNLRLLGSDLQYVFRIMTYLVNMNDISVYAQTRARFLPRAIPATTVAVSALAFPELLVEIEVTAAVAGR